jgi:hypothetical protein
MVGISIEFQFIISPATIIAMLEIPLTGIEGIEFILPNKHPFLCLSSKEQDTKYQNIAFHVLIILEFIPNYCRLKTY